MYQFQSRIRYSEVDSAGRLTLGSLINYFQDCSTFQSEDLGMGVEYLRETRQVWVLCAWQIVVDRYPVLGERVTVGTCPHELRGFLAQRNFAMTDEAGSYIARANSVWSLLSTETGKPVAVPEIMLEKYCLEPKLEMNYAPRKIAVPGEGERQEAVVVRKHHLDTNHHVNNQQYISMAMDFLPEDFVIRQVRAEYKKQAFLGDVLVPFVVKDGDRSIVSLKDESGAVYTVVEASEA